MVKQKSKPTAYPSKQPRVESVKPEHRFGGGLVDGAPTFTIKIDWGADRHWIGKSPPNFYYVFEKDALSAYQRGIEIIKDWAKIEKVRQRKYDEARQRKYDEARQRKWETDRAKRNRGIP